MTYIMAIEGVLHEVEDFDEAYYRYVEAVKHQCQEEGVSAEDVDSFHTEAETRRQKYLISGISALVSLRKLEDAMSDLEDLMRCRRMTLLSWDCYAKRLPEPMSDDEYLLHRGNQCPYCGSTDISSTNFDVDGPCATADDYCETCESSWVSHYRLIGYTEE